MGDQAASSLTNVLVAILVARSVGTAAAFGAFGLAMVVYQIVLGLSRSLVGEPFLARHARDPRDVRSALVAEVTSAAMTIGGAGALIVAVVGLNVSGLAGPGLVALAVVLPLVTVHDSLRFMFVVDRPQAALAIDLAWLALVVVAMTFAPADAGVAWYVAAWGLAGGVAAMVGLVLARPSRWGLYPLSWLRRTWHDGVRYAGDYATAQASAQVAFVVLGGISSLATLGAVRASQVFYGPLNTVHMGVYLAVVPDGVRLRHDPRRLQRLIVLTSTALGLLAAAWMVVGVWLPNSVGRELFDRSWPGAQQIMVPMGLSMIAGGVMSGGFLGIRSMGDARASLRSRLLSAPGQLVLPIVGAVLADAVGFALGAAAGRVLASGVWWTAFRRLVGVRSATDGADTAEVTVEPVVPAMATADGD